MEKDEKTIRFVGGPLDGQTRNIDQHLRTYEVDEPASPEGIHGGEVPVGFFPPFHKYVYEESSEDAGRFIYRG